MQELLAALPHGSSIHRARQRPVSKQQRSTLTGCHTTLARKAEGCLFSKVPHEGLDSFNRKQPTALLPAPVDSALHLSVLLLLLLLLIVLLLL